MRSAKSHRLGTDARVTAIFGGVFGFFAFFKQSHGKGKAESTAKNGGVTQIHCQG